VVPADYANAGAASTLQAHELGGRQMQVLPEEGIEGGVRGIVRRLNLIGESVHVEFDAHHCRVVWRMECSFGKAFLFQSTAKT